MSHICCTGHRLFRCDRTDNKRECESCIAWEEWHLQIACCFYQGKNINNRCNYEHCHQETIRFWCYRLHISCDTQTGRRRINTNQRFRRIRYFFELYITIGYKYKKYDQCYKSKPECCGSDSKLLISRCCNSRYSDSYIYNIIACKYFRHLKFQNKLHRKVYNQNDVKNDCQKPSEMFLIRLP